MTKKSPFPTDLRNALNKMLHVTFERVLNKEEEYMYALLLKNHPLDVFIMWDVSYYSTDDNLISKFHTFAVCVGHPRDRRSIHYFRIDYENAMSKVSEIHTELLVANKILRESAVVLSKGFME
jgi:hypothetical protein